MEFGVQKRNLSLKQTGSLEYEYSYSEVRNIKYYWKTGKNVQQYYKFFPDFPYFPNWNQEIRKTRNQEIKNTLPPSSPGGPHIRNLYVGRPPYIEIPYGGATLEGKEGESNFTWFLFVECVFIFVHKDYLCGRGHDMSIFYVWMHLHKNSLCGGGIHIRIPYQNNRQTIGCLWGRPKQPMASIFFRFF